MASGYTFDADAIAARIRDLESVRDRIRAQFHVLADIGLIGPPSEDDPARKQAQVATESVDQAAAHSHRMVQYAQAYLDSLNRAAGRYQEQDESTGALFEK